jgi:RNA polymerase sigma-70 factor, ECF subfamily
LVTDADDHTLVRDCLAGKPEAFEVLVVRYQRPLFNVALRLLGSYEDASDTTQTAFVKAYEHLDTFDSTHRFFSWVYKILRNECLNVLRARKPTEPLPEELFASGGQADALERVERQRAIQAAILKLPPDYREALVLRHFTELSYEEIATTLGIPVKTVKSRLYTARQRLAELLVEWQRQ